MFKIHQKEYPHLSMKEVKNIKDMNFQQFRLNVLGFSLGVGCVYVRTHDINFWTCFPLFCIVLILLIELFND